MKVDYTFTKKRQQQGIHADSVFAGYHDVDACRAACESHAQCTAFYHYRLTSWPVRSVLSQCHLLLRKYYTVVPRSGVDFYAKVTDCPKSSKLLLV